MKKNTDKLPRQEKIHVCLWFLLVFIYVFIYFVLFFCCCCFCRLGVVVKWENPWSAQIMKFLEKLKRWIKIAPRQHQHYLSFFFLQDFSFTYLLHLINWEGSGPPVITISLWLNNATQYFSTSLLQAVITTSLSWSMQKKKTLIITETVQTFQVIAIYLTFFRGINLEICYALYL